MYLYTPNVLGFLSTVTVGSTVPKDGRRVTRNGNTPWSSMQESAVPLEDGIPESVVLCVHAAWFMSPASCAVALNLKGSLEEAVPCPS